MSGGESLAILSQGRLLKGSTPEKLSLLISHDCDLDRDDEPYFEVIDGKIVSQPNGGLTHGKSPRKLHLELIHSGKIIFAEFEIKNKRYIPKSSYKLELDESYSITQPNLNSLRSWLAARYNRSALPDKFNDWLKETGLDKFLAKKCEPLGNTILAIYFDIRNFDEEPASPTNPYDIDIHLLYEVTSNPLESAAQVSAIAEEIEQKFKQVCKSGKEYFDLGKCLALSEAVMSVYELRTMHKYEEDYRSLKQTPQQPTVASKRKPMAVPRKPVPKRKR